MKYHPLVIGCLTTKEKVGPCMVGSLSGADALPLVGLYHINMVCQFFLRTMFSRRLGFIGYMLGH